MCDHDPPAVYSLTMRKARKRHPCVECRHGVQPGTVYAEHSGLWEGRWATYRQCARCYRVCVALEKGGAECMLFGGMRTELRERSSWRRRRRDVEVPNVP